MVWKCSRVLQISDMQNLYCVGLKEIVTFGIVIINRKVAFKWAHNKVAWMCGTDFCPNFLLMLSIKKSIELASDNYTYLRRECVIRSEYFTTPCGGIWRTYCRRGFMLWAPRCKYASYSGSRDGVIGVVTTLWLANRRMVFRFLVGKRDIYLPQTAQARP